MWTVNIMINNYTVEFSIDIEADVTVIPEQLYKQTFNSTSLQATCVFYFTWPHNSPP